jgi:hypothetical protein
VVRISCAGNQVAAVYEDGRIIVFGWNHEVGWLEDYRCDDFVSTTNEKETKSQVKTIERIALCSTMSLATNSKRSFLAAFLNGKIYLYNCRKQLKIGELPVVLTTAENMFFVKRGNSIKL